MGGKLLLETSDTERGLSTRQKCPFRGQTASQDLDSPVAKASVQFPWVPAAGLNWAGGLSGGSEKCEAVTQ